MKKVTNYNPEKQGQQVVGWLILHTEERDPVFYDLFLGDNFFGAEAHGYEVDIPIQGDKYISRSHAHIQIRQDLLQRLHFELLDDGTGRPQGPSTNGTYVNGQKSRIPADSQVFLQDGDTIQVGQTKLVFMSKRVVENVTEAASAVLQTDYTETVHLGDHK